MQKYCQSDWLMRSEHCMKCPYSEYFWSVFSRILSVFSPNAGKYGPEKLRVEESSRHCIQHL